MVRIMFLNNNFEIKSQNSIYSVAYFDLYYIHRNIEVLGIRVSARERNLKKMPYV